MNKFVFFALTALVAVVSASPIDEPSEHALSEVEEPSQLALFENDEVEIKNLPEDQEIFVDFCKSARDEAEVLFKQKLNNGVQAVFDNIMDTLRNIVKNVGEANNIAIENGSKMIGNDARQARAAVGDVVSTTTKTSMDQIMFVLESLKELVSSETLIKGADEVCKFTMDVKTRLDGLFRKYKSENVGKDAKLRFEDLRCLTTSRISRAVTTCSMFNSMKVVFPDVLG